MGTLQLALRLIRGIICSRTIKRLHGLSLNTLDELLARRNIMDQANDLTGSPYLHAVSGNSCLYALGDHILRNQCHPSGKLGDHAGR